MSKNKKGLPRMSMHRNKFISAAITTAIATTTIIPAAHANDTAGDNDTNNIVENSADNTYENIENEIPDNLVTEEVTDVINHNEEDTISSPSTEKLVEETPYDDISVENTRDNEKTEEHEVSENEKIIEDRDNHIVDDDQSIETYEPQNTYDNHESHSVTQQDALNDTNLQTHNHFVHDQGVVENTIDENKQVISHDPQPAASGPEIQQHVDNHIDNITSQAKNTSQNVQQHVEKTDDKIRHIAGGVALPLASLAAVPFGFQQLKNINHHDMVNSEIKKAIALLEKNNIPVHDIIAQYPKEVKQAIAPFYTAPSKHAPIANVTYASQHVSAPAQRPKPNSSTQSKKAVDFAHSRIGTPYVYGGTTDAGYDCSGFVQAAYRSAGVNIPRTTYEQANYGRSVSRAELQPGDLIFYGNGGPSTSYHAAMYIGNGQVIHSPQSGDSVKKAPMDMMRISAMKRPV